MLLQQHMMYPDQHDIPNTTSDPSLANLQYPSELIANFNWVLMCLIPSWHLSA